MNTRRFLKSWIVGVLALATSATATFAVQTVTLETNRSFDFASGAQAFLAYGDLYLSTGADGNSPPIFWANNLGQRGLKSMGNLGNIDLASVIPTAGFFTRYGVPVVVGETYVSWLKDPASGQYVVFRVTGVTTDSVTMDYEIVQSANVSLAIKMHPESITYVMSGYPVTAELNVGAVGNGPISYQWRKYGQAIPGATSHRLAIPNLSAGDIADYDCVVSLGAESVTSHSASINKEPDPRVEIAPQARSAPLGSWVGFKSYVRGTPPFTYQWRKDEQDIPGATSDGLIIPVVEPSSAGIYEVVATNAISSSVSYVRLSIGDNPVRSVTMGAAYFSFARGTTAWPVQASDFGVLFSPTPSFWSNNLGQRGMKSLGNLGTVPLGSVIPTAGGYTRYAVPIVAGNTYVSWLSAAEDGQYAVLRVTDVTSTSVTFDYVIVASADQPLAILMQPEATGRLAGTNAELNVGAIGSGPISYQWRKAGAPIAGATSPRLYIDPVQVADSGSYDVIVSANGQTVISNAVALTILANPTASISPQNPRVAVGASVTFQGYANGSYPMTYQWSKDGQPLAGATGTTLSIPNVQPADTGTYEFSVTNANGTAKAATTLAIAQPPTITSYSPTTVNVGTQVVILGTDLNAVTKVQFSGINASYVVNSPTKITATVPAGLAPTLTGVLSITSAEGTFSSPVLFAYTPPAPTITSYSPTTLGSGAQVVILGTDLNAVTSVQFNGINAAFSINNSTRITATVPNGLNPTTTGVITITSSAGVYSSSILFTYTNAPTITSLSPSAGPVGRMVTINGANLAAPTSVTFGGAPVTATQIGSQTAWKVVVPPEAVTGPVVLTTINGSAVSPGVFTVTPAGTPPANDAFANASPISGSSGSTSGLNVFATAEPAEPSHTGGAVSRSVWLKWTAPESGPFAFDTRLSDFCTFLKIYTGTSVDSLVPVASSVTPTNTVAPRYMPAVLNATAGVDYYIAVDTFEGISGRYQVDWAKLANPTITNFSPKSAYFGQSIVISGSNFYPGISVTIGGQPVNPRYLNVSSPNNMVAGLPYGAVTGPITVSGLNGLATSADSVTVVSPPPPTITSLTPSSGAIGTRIRIGGTALSLTDALPQVRFNGLPALVEADSTIAILTYVPAGATTGRVTVQTSAGTGTSAIDFVVTSPVVTGFTPTTGRAGDAVVVTGANLGGTTAVTVGGVNAPFTINSPTQLTVVIPAGATSGRIEILTNTGSAQSAGDLAVVNDYPPSLLTVPPSQTVTVGDRVVLSVTVAGTAPFTYRWLKDGNPMPGGNASSLVIPSVLTADAGSYVVVVSNAVGVVQSPPAVLTVNKAVASVAISRVEAVYDGLPHPVTVTTDPSGLGAVITYAGAAAAPTNAGSYAVTATVDDPNYTGSANATLLIRKAAATVTLGNLSQTYDGTPRNVTVTTQPEGLTTIVTYDGSTAAPIFPGLYAVTAALDEPNYDGAATDTLSIGTTVLSRHPLKLSGTVDGSVQVLEAEAIALGGGASILEDLLVPGTPNVDVQGSALLGGILEGTGATRPPAYQIKLTGSALVRYIVTCVDPVAMPTVERPASPQGTLDLKISGKDPVNADFSAVRDLTVNGELAVVPLPPGNYRKVTATAQATLVLGTPNSTTASVYAFDSLTLAGSSTLRVAGPVILTVAGSFQVNGSAGEAGKPQWLAIKMTTGDLALDSGSKLSAEVIAPNGEVVLNGTAELTGKVICDRLTVNGGGHVVQQSPNL